MNFQDLIMRLEHFWASQGCVIQQPYDLEVGAGTMNPATTLRVLGPEPWRVAYVEPSRRPTDGRYGENRTAFSIITSIRSSSSRLPTTFRSSTSRASSISASTPRSMTSASSRTTGRTRPPEPGGSDGRSGSTEWKSRSSRISSRWEPSTWTSSPPS